MYSLSISALIRRHGGSSKDESTRRPVAAPSRASEERRVRAAVPGRGSQISQGMTPCSKCRRMVATCKRLTRKHPLELCLSLFPSAT
eukprot:13112051-Heterocapsa_arctica.AAC.1